MEKIVVLLMLNLVVVQKPVILYSLIILVNLSGMVVYLNMDKMLFTNVVLLNLLNLFMIIVLISLLEKVILLTINALSYQNVNLKKILLQMISGVT